MIWFTVAFAQQTLLVPNDYPTINDAVAAAAPGDTIDIGAGTYPEDIVVPVGGLTFQGAGAGITVIEPAAGRRAFSASGVDELTVSELSIRGGQGILGDGLETLVVSRVAFAALDAEDGPAIYATQFKTVSVSESVFDKNVATSSGGHIYVESGDALTITNSSFAAGSAAKGGAVFALEVLDLSVTGGRFDINSSTGGAVFGAVQSDIASTALFTDTVFLDSDAPVGDVNFDSAGTVNFDGTRHERAGAGSRFGGSIVATSTAFTQSYMTGSGEFTVVGDVVVAASAFVDGDGGSALRVLGDAVVVLNSLFCNAGTNAIDSDGFGLVDVRYSLLTQHLGTAVDAGEAGDIETAANIVWENTTGLAVTSAAKVNAVDSMWFGNGLTIDEVIGGTYPILNDVTTTDPGYGRPDCAAFPIWPTPLAAISVPAGPEAGGKPPYGVDIDKDGFCDSWACAGEQPFDCNDGDGTVFPKGLEVAGDGIDSDCDGFEECIPDVDGDGYGSDKGGTATGDLLCSDGATSLTTDDCDDTDPTVNPGAIEVVGDQIDSDCDGEEICFLDNDDDDYRSTTEVTSADSDCTDPFESGLGKPLDCDDNDPTSFLEEPVFCDGDGDGVAGSDSVLACGTAEADLLCPLGYDVKAGPDCDDADADIFPGADEVIGDGIDQSCSGGDGCYADGDHDGARSDVVIDSFDLDCDDTGEALPAAALDCDDGDITVQIEQNWYADCDGDAVADASSVYACGESGADGLTPCTDAQVPDGGWTLTAGADCDDEDAGATELADWYADCDGDGEPSAVAINECGAPTASPCVDGLAPDGGWSLTPGLDCDDEDAGASTGSNWYADCDADGEPSAALVFSCGAPAVGLSPCGDAQAPDGGWGLVAGSDCNDEDPTGTAVELWYPDCDGDGGPSSVSSVAACGVADADAQLTCAGGGDSNASTAVPTDSCDEDAALLGPVVHYPDCDGDGGFDASAQLTLCPFQALTTFTCAADKVPDGGFALTANGDCNDEDATATTDETWSADCDADGQGATTNSTSACGVIEAESLLVCAGGGDANPVLGVASDACDEDALVVSPLAYYADCDADGVFASSSGAVVCPFDVATAVSCVDSSVPDGGWSIVPSTDCDDEDAVGQALEDWYADCDGDGYAGLDTLSSCGANDAAADWLVGCGLPAAFVTNILPFPDDCDDGTPQVFPGAPETRNDGVDQDCDGYDLLDTAATGITGTTGDTAVDTGVDTGVDTAGPTGDTGAVCVDAFWDLDVDGFGDPLASVLVCGPLATNQSLDGTDCDDSEATVYPTAPEVCDGLDNDCNTLDDDGLAPSVWSADCDGDGYFADAGLFACGPDALATPCVDGLQPDGGWFEGVGDDCRDEEPGTNPGADDLLPGDGDQNCDGIDGTGCSDYYQDLDGDGYGNEVVVQSFCGAPDPGWVAFGLFDCDDTEDRIRPETTERCDGVDTNCDDAFLPGELDSDGDRFLGCSYDLGYGFLGAGAPPIGWDDCDDTAADVNPGVFDEGIDDGIDSDCDGFEACLSDADGDGYSGDEVVSVPGLCPTFLGSDCDDQNPSIYEGCDLQGMDCFVDADGDGYGSTTPAVCAASLTSTNDDDCDDTSATSFPGGVETCDGFDNDCSGVVDDGFVALELYPDADGDGWGTDEDGPVLTCEARDGFVAEAGDCDDTSDAFFPGAADVCGEDRNCDGQVLACTGADLDGDGYCDSDVCDPGVEPGDCDDNDPDRHPGAPEQCDLIDDNCDGLVDEGLSSDADGDGAAAFGSCFADAYDCNDFDPDVNPFTYERCNGIDDDCDGRPDDGLYYDLDGDGWLSGCVPAGLPVDCDDSNAGVHPHAVETAADTIDVNCDGQVGVPSGDVDGDGYCGSGGQDLDGDGTCTGPLDDPTAPADCDEGTRSTSPGATEISGDGVDNDCDGVIDEGDGLVIDNDGDGYPWPDDCDDERAYVNPGADELCDGFDTNCDGELPADEADWDQDGFAICDGDCDDRNGTRYPLAPEDCTNGLDDNCDGISDLDSNVDNDGDGRNVCDDGDCWDNAAEWPPGFDAGFAASVYPGADDVCDGMDNNCNGLIDEGFDLDGDGYRDCVACALEHPDCDCDDLDSDRNPGRVELCYDGIDNDCREGADDGGDTDLDGWDVCEGDCNDYDRDVHPSGDEVCDQKDNNCNGLVDEGSDVDLDGHRSCEGDCDDADPSVYPYQAENCVNGVDDDCDLFIDVDDDECDPLEDTGLPEPTGTTGSTAETGPTGDTALATEPPTTETTTTVFTVDTALPTKTPGTKPPEEGCGCRTGSPGAFGWLLAGLLVVRRRAA